MTASNFDRALSLVLVHEGGYVNHPADPGGATNKGVTQATYNSWRKSRGLVPRSVKSITDAEVATIYKNRYWHTVKGDDLPSGLDYAVFDFGVNSGPSRAAKFLQNIVGAHQDGIIGPETLRAVAAHNTAGTINRLLDNRLAWLKRLSTWRTFGKGWTRRIAGVRKDALAMVGNSVPEPQQPDDPGVDPERPSEPVQDGWLIRFFRWLFG